MNDEKEEKNVMRFLRSIWIKLQLHAADSCTRPCMHMRCMSLMVCYMPHKPFSILLAVFVASQRKAWLPPLTSKAVVKCGG
jgi:hypothetical protein